MWGLRHTNHCLHTEKDPFARFVIALGPRNDCWRAVDTSCMLQACSSPLMLVYDDLLNPHQFQYTHIPCHYHYRRRCAVVDETLHVHTFYLRNECFIDEMHSVVLDIEQELVAGRFLSALDKVELRGKVSYVCTHLDFGREARHPLEDVS